ncbi:type 4a pilus biogenesis protein PilO [Paenibacillus tianjinensis]|uniref:Type 4a pilus biogenesis protein PilO n=1 Tax=Paenibacillus tianjinensis TaxID=2810347 RepID=A0ABX7L976_9BACL|nr:type 4a pilus biogenesis protein PilO [Paenibacillus tianjinensis]QSF44709.1 type 4a pilus biogenesis protein PilO [Paenibacillus tianjinensis]
MEQINKYRSPIVLGVLVLFLLLFAFFLFGVKPVNRQIEDQDLQIGQLEQQNGLLKTKIDELKSSSEANQEQEALLAQLPRGDASEQLILDLRTIGSYTNARLKDIGFAIGENNPIQEMTGSADIAFPTVKQLKMTAIVEGEYTSIRNWLTALQLMPRIINVDSFSFQQSEDSAANGESGSIITANISFTAYYEDAPDSPKTEAQVAIK